MTNLEFVSEIRGWTLLLFAVVGGVITILAYRHNQRQRRLENSFRFLAQFKETVSESDRSAWETLFDSTTDTAGAPYGFFITHIEGVRQQIPLSALFAEGSTDNGAIERMAEFFEMIALEDEERTINLRVIYYQLGHYMDTVHEWILSFPDENGRVFMNEHFPAYSAMYSKNRIKRDWKCRRLATTH